MRACHPSLVDRLYRRLRQHGAERPRIVRFFKFVHPAAPANTAKSVDHLHEHFVYPVSINSRGRYNVPSHGQEGYSIQVS